MPRTLWVAGGVAVAATAAIVAGLWFDRLFESPDALVVPSLVDHTGALSVLAVLAHPDDETLAAGVLADAASREGVVVRTITLTAGEAGSSEPASSPDDLRLIRESELRRYGAALGIDHQEIWTYPDGKLEASLDREIVDRTVERIRTWKPDLILTFDPTTGFNGHPDHRAAGRTATTAVYSALDTRYRADLGSAHRSRTIAYMLAPARAFATLGGPELQAIAAAQPDANLAVPVDPDLRILGWRIHESQHLERAYPLPGWLLFAFWDKEHYRIVEAPLLDGQPGG